MKTIIIAFGFAMISTAASAQGYGYGTGSNPNSHSVQGYTRSNGTYVPPSCDKPKQHHFGQLWDSRKYESIHWANGNALTTLIALSGPA